MESILHKIRFSYTSMGRAEKKIADYILNNTATSTTLSISELASACGCGDATVVRFSRRLGLDGYQELKIRLAGDLSASSQISASIAASDSCFEIFQKRIADISSSLYNTESVLDAGALDKAAKTIMNADRIAVFGLGSSAAIAQDATHKFLRLGLAAQCCCDNHMQAIIASHLKRGSVAIGISHSGSSADIVDALKLCKICGATTICITNFNNSPIVEASDIALFTHSEETKHSILAMSSRIAQLAIFDSIYTYIVLNTEKAAKQAIYNTEIALKGKKLGQKAE
ncbi:MAG: MurR/RpiR family transcriptional regulator [Clostridia bacterium]|nr:MurR/RpiR family transcriptional regulator [Clostridia bacterium]